MHIYSTYRPIYCIHISYIYLTCKQKQTNLEIRKHYHPVTVYAYIYEGVLQGNGPPALRPGRPRERQ